MDWKKFFLTLIVLFVILELGNMLIHMVILGAQYEAKPEIWRPGMEGKMWIMYMADLIFCFFFVFIYARGREGKGVMEGVRFGLLIIGFYVIPHLYTQYVVYPVPYYFVMQWLIYDGIKIVVLGIVASLLYKPTASAV